MNFFATMFQLSHTCTNTLYSGPHIDVVIFSKNTIRAFLGTGAKRFLSCLSCIFSKFFQVF